MIETEVVWEFFISVRDCWNRFQNGAPDSPDWASIRAVAQMCDFPMSLREFKKINSLFNVSREFWWTNHGEGSKK